MKKFIAAPFGNYIKTKNTISVSGSWTVEKRTGRIIQIAKTLRYTKKGWVNKIGLRNPGVELGITKYREDEVFSIAGIEKDDWKISKILIDLVISDGGQITPSRFDSFANSNSKCTLSLVSLSMALLVRAELTPSNLRLSMESDSVLNFSVITFPDIECIHQNQLHQ